MKKIILLIVFAIALISCEKNEDVIIDDSIEENLSIEVRFPRQISLQDFLEKDMEIKLGIDNGFSALGPLNDIEWYIEDQEGNVKYYELDTESAILTAKDNFSGIIATYEADVSERRSELCSYDLHGGCTISVTVGWSGSTLIVTCPHGLAYQHYPALSAPYLCLTAWQTVQDSYGW